MRDHQDREALLAQAVEHVEDARADRDVEHRDRLVGDEHLGLEDERRGDRDPLTLAARQLVRIPVEVELGRRELDTDECIANPRGSLGLRAAEPVDQRAAPRPPHGRGTAGRATRTDPGRRPGSGDGAAAARAGRAARGRDRRSGSSRRRDRRAAAPPGRSSSCRSPTRRRGRASLPAAATATRPRRRARCGAAGAWPTRRGRGGSGSGRRDPRPRAVSARRSCRHPRVEVAGGVVIRRRAARAAARTAQASKTESQRGANGQPSIGRSSRGGAPAIESTGSSSPARSGDAANNMRLYGCPGVVVDAPRAGRARRSRRRTSRRSGCRAGPRPAGRA